MKRFWTALGCLAVVGLLFGHPVRAKASEEITLFANRITVRSDQSLAISETINYVTTEEKHGIFRYIPIRYEQDGKSYSLPIREVKVTDPSGTSIQFTRSSDGRNLTLKIGDPNRTFTGAKSYVISYVVDGALSSTQQGLRLYWDITGEGWDFPVKKSQSSVTADTGLIKDITCYAGKFGTNDGLCTAEMVTPHQAEFSYNQPINYGDNFTIDVQFQGTTGFTNPTALQKLVSLLMAYWWIGLFFLPPGLCFYIWYKYGRDYMFVRYNPYDFSERPAIIKPIFFRITAPFVYEPLDITPGQAGVMLDESYDMRDLTADILDLARKKFLKIELISKKTLFKPADYNFTSLKKADASLPNHQVIILEGLFESGKTTRLSELKGVFFKNIDRIKTSVFEELFNQTCFSRDPWKFKKKVFGWAVVGGIVLFVAGQGLLPFALEQSSIFFVILLTALDAVLVFICINALTQKTARGFNYWLLARGLRETIKRGKWRQQIMEKHLFIEEILPFAVALNVVDQLSRDMKELGLEPPKYMGGTNFGTAAFVSSFTSDLGAGLTYNPSSSSSGGGGFGGGSSGGGGGGGGGGSW